MSLKDQIGSFFRKQLNWQNESNVSASKDNLPKKNARSENKTFDKFGQKPLRWFWDNNSLRSRVRYNREKKQFFLLPENYQQKIANNEPIVLKMYPLSGSTDDVYLPVSFLKSIFRTVNRFLKQLFFNIDRELLDEFEVERYVFITSLKCLLLFIFIPFTVNIAAKHFLLKPITNYWFNQPTLFLNKSIEKHAYKELQNYKETLYFDTILSLDERKREKDLSHFWEKKIEENSQMNFNSINLNSTKEEGTKLINFEPISAKKKKKNTTWGKPQRRFESLKQKVQKFQKSFYLNWRNSHSFYLLPKKHSNGIHFRGAYVTPTYVGKIDIGIQPIPDLMWRELEPELGLKEILNLSGRLQQDAIYHEKGENLLDKLKDKKDTNTETYVAMLLTKKMEEIGLESNEQSIRLLIDFTAQLLTVISILCLIRLLEDDIEITKALLLDVFLSIKDNHRGLFLFFITDLLVGHHSTKSWHLFFEIIFDYYGFGNNTIAISFSSAFFPSLLDVLLKYLIYIKLNKIAPTSVINYTSFLE